MALRLLHVTEACAAGVRRHLQLIIPELCRQGVECSVLAYGTRAEPDFENDILAWRRLGCKATLVRLVGTSINTMGKARQLIQRACQACEPDVVHLHAFFAGFVARKALSGIPVVYSPHAFSVHKPIPFLKRLSVSVAEKTLSWKTDAYALVGAEEVNVARSLGIASQKLHLACNGLPDTFRDTLLPRAEARRVLGIPQDGMAAAVPCRLAPQKGLVTLFQALPGDFPYKVYVFGEGPLREELLRLVTERKLEDKVVLAGNVPGFSRYLKAFDLSIIPSEYEGLSYSILETLAADIPLIASDIPENHFLPGLRDKISFFRQGSVEDLARALSAPPTQACTSDELLAHFSLAKQVQKLLEIYAGVSRRK